jgi:hypothetical protein
MGVDGLPLWSLAIRHQATLVEAAVFLFVQNPQIVLTNTHGYRFAL